MFPHNCLTAQTCAPATDSNLESDCVMIRPSSTAQEKVPFSHTSAQKKEKKKKEEKRKKEKKKRKKRRKEEKKEKKKRRKEEKKKRRKKKKETKRRKRKNECPHKTLFMELYPTDKLCTVL